VRKVAGLALAATLVACAGGPAALRSTPSTAASPTSGSSPSPGAGAPSPSPRPAGLLFAVLENSKASAPQFQFQNDTVAIAGLDGYARAKQHFTARAVPGLCDAGLLVQPEAYVADGHVYYVDGHGVVRGLAPTGAVTQLTAFGLGPQQVLSFAVDPTGQQLVAARQTVPTFAGGLPCQQTGDYAVDLYAAGAGASPQLTYHQAYQQATGAENWIQAVGWDPAGALITVQDNLGTQNGTLGQKWFGQLAHLTPQGIGAVVGGSDCRAQDEVGNSIACISNQGEGAGSVRAPDGSVQWNLPSAIYYFIRLAPDATRAAYCNSSQCGVASRDGTNLKLPQGFGPTGWLDASTLIGVTGSDQYGGVLGTPYGELATVSLADPSQVDDLGFKGMFVGVVQRS
jgi:hypothetical protein